MNTKKDGFLARLDKLYEQYIGIRPEHTQLRDTIYNALSETRDANAEDRIESFLREEGRALAPIVQKWRQHSILYADSVILLIYHLLLRNKEALLENWPLLPNELEPFATDIGVALYPEHG